MNERNPESQSPDSAGTARPNTNDAVERERMYRDTLVRFSAAWDAGDVDGLLALMSDEPVYKGSTGPLPGKIARGREQVRAVLEHMAGGNAGRAPGVPASAPPIHVFGNRALTFWQLDFPDAEGKLTAVDGVDVFTFDGDGRIAVKDAYRKAFV